MLMTHMNSYFTKDELQDLFKLDDPSTSETQLQLARVEEQLGLLVDDDLRAHRDFLMQLGIVPYVTISYAYIN